MEIALFQEGHRKDVVKAKARGGNQGQLAAGNLAGCRVCDRGI